jgi:uncharacterized protein
MFKGYKKIKQSIQGKSYTLWVADNVKKRQQGLKGIKSLAPRTGMLFLYDNEVNTTFTMKGVNIPLKLIFLDRYMNIINDFNCKPGQTNIGPNKPFKYVIEIPVKI